jgi:hypothetical protein
MFGLAIPRAARNFFKLALIPSPHPNLAKNLAEKIIKSNRLQYSK